MNDEIITVKDSNNKEVDDKQLKEYINMIAPKIEDDIKKMLLEYMVKGGAGRMKAIELSKKVHISGLKWLTLMKNQ